MGPVPLGSVRKPTVLNRRWQAHGGNAFMSSCVWTNLMLPDTIHKLPESERFAYARVLAAIARSDDEITIEEMAMFEQRLGTALLSPGQRNVIRQSLKSDPIPLPELLEDIGPEGGKLALRDAVMMAKSSGWQRG